MTQAWTLRDKVTKNWIAYESDSEIMQFYESTIPHLFEKREELEKLRNNPFYYRDLKYSSGYSHIGPDALEIVEIQYTVIEK